MTVDISHLHLAVQGKTLLDDVSLQIDDSERVGLIGVSGSGKSMISRACLGLLPPHMQLQGSIRIGGQEMVGADEGLLADMRGKAIALVMQDPASALNPVKRIADQIALPLRLHYSLNRQQIHERVVAMLRKVDVPLEAMRRFPHQLSGGQQQRVAIATALVTSPRFIVADEPTTALDPITQRQIVDLLVSLVDDAGASMLFITHDFSVLSQATNRCYVLDGGRIAESGRTLDLLRSPEQETTRGLVDAARMLTFHADEHMSISTEYRQGGRSER
ncbi:MAG: ABC transporter ATP-binding protein [Bifidobacterium crudilactis]|jgi:peptide/nickel transport system ATP-binding protein|nr:ABC transporter ATP-binding protein [Bifidobacterium crudilactis]